MNRARRLAAIGLAFNKVILDSVADSFEAHRFILHAGQHHDRQIRRCRPGADKRVTAIAIRQGQVQQQHIEGLLQQVRGGLGPTSGLRESESADSMLG